MTLSHCLRACFVFAKVVLVIALGLFTVVGCARQKADVVPRASLATDSAPQASTPTSISPSVTPEPAPSRPRRFPRGPTRWLGSYTCGQGLTRLELTLTRDVQTNDLTATFAFSAHPRNPGVPSGRFTLTGSYDPEQGGVELAPQTWLDRPQNYAMVGLRGTLEVDPWALSGRVSLAFDGLNNCTTFAVKRVQPGDDWPPEPPPPAPPPTPEAKSPRVIARVDGRDLTTSEVESYAHTTQLSLAAGLEDLIDLTLVTNAAQTHALSAPPAPWSAAARADVEIALADALGIPTLSQIDNLVVDHAWVKDVRNKKTQAEQRQSIDKLRQRVLAGQPLQQAWQSLGVDGTNWHVAEKEEYAAPILPESVGKLKAGEVSKVIADDGGLEIFILWERRPHPEAVENRRQILVRKLRAAANIERLVEVE